jgi:hypothetical protein
MTDHVTQQVLEAVQTALQDAATAAGSRVYLDRIQELPQDDLPAIDILGLNDGAEEVIEHATLGIPTIQRRTLSFPVYCITRGLTGSPRAARNLAGQVEAALLASASAIVVGSTNILMALTGARGERRLDSALPFFSVGQEWTATYFTTAGAPTAVA